ncbi:MAG: efflux RND transporter periplasmic adaptor subunit [Gammaproteobacteria bacterium]
MNTSALRSAALIALMTALAACSPAQSGPADAPPRAVRVAAVTQGPAQRPVEGSGVVAPADEARLAFKVGGIVDEIHVHAGDTVQAGQVLATLETTEIDAAVVQAREAYDKAQRDLARGRQLFEDDVLTQEQLDDLGTAAAVARSQLDAAEFNRRHAEIRAPADGRVLRRLAEPRELVSPGQPVLQVSSGGRGWVMKLGLPDRDFVDVRVGDAARVRFDAFPRREFAGRVSQRGGAADPRTGTFPIEIEIDAGDAALAAGLIGRAEIEVGNGETLDYVPLAALVEGSADSTLLFLYDDASQTVAARRVPVAFLAGEQAALASALPADSRVVTDGAAYLHDGDAVRVVD